MNEIINFWINRLGDPYISSWINTIFYACSFIAAIYKRRNLKRNRSSSGEQYFWLFLIIVLFLFGVNKQFDFQTMLIEAGRQISQYGHWYEKRRLVQACFAYGLFGVVITILFIMFIRLSTKEFWRHNALAAIGLGVMCLYLVARTTSISHVGFVADSKSKGEFRLTDIVEFIGILCIFVNALTGRKTETGKTPRERISKTIRRKHWFSWGLSVIIGIGMVAFFQSPFRSFLETHSFTIGHWRPGIGDASFMGWLTVCSYYVAAGVCFLKLFTEQVRQQRQERTFWIFLCFSMVVLGAIKQFNLLVAVDEILRIIAHSRGVYEQRRTVQAFVMAIVGVVFLVTVIHTLRTPVVVRHKITAMGFLYLLLFVLFRGISLHQFEDFLSYEILGVRVNWMAELTGIYWICLASFLSLAPKTPSAEAFIKKGADYHRVGDARNAINAFNKAIDLDPCNAEAYVFRAEAYDKLEDYDEMLRDSDNAIRLGLESPRAYANRGLAQAMLGKYEESIRDLKIAARLGHKEAQEALKKQGIGWN
jgi:tetratricopeptide (TPR) repeat protein